MEIKIQLEEADVKRLIVNEISAKLGDISFDPKDVIIEVKSKQNYRAEWEPASFRAVYHKL